MPDITQLVGYTQHKYNYAIILDLKGLLCITFKYSYIPPQKPFEMAVLMK